MNTGIRYYKGLSREVLDIGPTVEALEYAVDSINDTCNADLELRRDQLA